jgi:hypothetical protein
VTTKKEYNGRRRKEKEIEMKRARNKKGMRFMIKKLQYKEERNMGKKTCSSEIQTKGELQK